MKRFPGSIMLRVFTETTLGNFDAENTNKNKAGDTHTG